MEYDFISTVDNNGAVVLIKIDQINYVREVKHGCEIFMVNHDEVVVDMDIEALSSLLDYIKNVD